MTDVQGGAPIAARVDDAADLVAAIRKLDSSIKLSTQQTARLAAAVEAALAHLATAATRAATAVEAKSASALEAPVPADTPADRLTVNWVIGPADNIGWAYGNNAKRLGGQLKQYAHLIADTGPSDLAVYFDAIVAERFKVDSKKSILRIGGPRPLDRLFGDDVDAMARAFQKFDAIIALNGELYLRALRAHHNVHLIPNALDLKVWHPNRRTAAEDRPFTVGFAASLKSSVEAETKGYAIARAAAARVGAKLLLTSKGDSQIPHDRMIQDFYSKIDALVHPSGPGREGTSNVVMEALAIGVPVITTVHSGFHGEFLVDGKTALVRARDELSFAEAIATLQRDERVRRKLVAEGRLFAERHHDAVRAAEAYGEIMADLLAPKAKVSRKRKKVAFVPFWEPMANFGSSRLRAKYPAEYVTRLGRFAVSIGYSPDADIVVIVQMCDDSTMSKLKENPGQFLIYDVCDKYYDNPRIFKHIDPPVDSLARFKELGERADLIIVPTRELKAEIASRLPNRPVKFVPEPVDYGASSHNVRDFGQKTVLWFGNPDRGNFESARWMIERLRDKHGFTPIIVSRKSFFKKHPDLDPFCRDWSMEAMEQAFGEASVCVVAYDDAEQAKSPNRFISAIMQGLPTIVCNSPACDEILEETGHTFAAVSNERDLDRAINKLGGEEFRTLYVRRVQRHLTAKFGEKAIAETYSNLFQDHTYNPAVFSKRPRRIAFVSHNLAVGEGAPWSLFELVTGLRQTGQVEPFVFCAASGPLAEQYAKASVPLEVFDPNARHTVKVLNTRMDAIRRAFISFLKTNKIEAVVCNTVKAAPFVEFARSAGVPGMVIVRESYGPDERFVHFTGDAKLAAILGLTAAQHIVFVAEASRAAWVDQPFGGKVRVIPNGISPMRFAQGAAETKAAARARLGLPADQVIGLCVGTINARKGQRELMDAFAELPAELRATSGIIFLGAVENSQLADFNKAYEATPPEVREKLRVVEATEDVTAYYKAADIFLMNSSSEAYPRSIVEGLLFKLPVISTRVFGVKEQVKENESGFLYDINDMGAWKGHFSLLASDAALREKMSDAAYRAFWKLTGYEEMLLSYRAIIADMVGM